MYLKTNNINNKFFLICLLVFYFCQTYPILASKEPLIRVLVSKRKNLRIRSDRSIPLIIESQDFSKKKIKGLTLKTDNDRSIIFFDKDKQKIYDLNKNDKLKVKSNDGRGIWVGQKRYSGILNLIILDSEILLINVLGIEKYLSSVVGSEMPTKWPLEALKAQAIASRTYALKQKGNSLYDIDSTQKHQVYNGLGSRTHKTMRAVRSTRSLVLTYKNKLINALFHSSSGGMTENSQDVWKNEYPYLISVKDFDKNNPKLRWQKNFSNKDLEKLFPRIGGINKIEILGVTNTGRVKNVKLHGNLGSHIFSGVDLRKKMNLKSTLMRFKIIEDKNKISDNKNPYKAAKKKLIIVGYGSGHGVGMSQWGARYMASKGQKAEKILKHFYQGVRINPFDKTYL